MALERQVVSLPFSQGIDTKTDPKQVVPGKLITLENGVLGTTGTSLQKRWGYAKIADLGAGRLVATLKDELFVADGVDGYALASTGLVYKGTCTALGVKTTPVIRNTYRQSTPDIAAHPLGVSVFTWEDSSGGSRYSVHDSVTGQPIVSNQPIGTTASKPKPLVVGNYVVVVFYETTTSHLQFFAVPATSPTHPTAPADLATNPDASQVFDATVIGQRVFVTYLNNTAGNKVSLLYVTSALGVSAEVQVATEVYSGTTTIFGDATSGRVWLAYYNGTAVKACAYDYSLATQILAATTVDASPGTVRNITGIVLSGGSAATLFYEAQGAAPHFALVKTAQVSSAGVISGNGVCVRSVGLASKAFGTSTAMVLTAHQSALQPTYFLVAKTGTVTGSVIGKLAPGIGGGLTAKSILPEAQQVSSGVYSTAFLQADLLSSVDGNIYTQTGVMRADLDFTAPQLAQELSEDLHATGGMLWLFDGAQVTEHSFHLYPENVTATASGSGSFTGSYQLSVVFEWVDNYGQVHRSAPSVPVTVAATSAGQFDITVPTLRLTQKATPISVVIYRTRANQVIFYRTTSIASPLYNSTSADTVSYTDTLADTSLIGNEQLYTTGGEVENIAAPAPAVLTQYKGRAIIVPAEQPLSWWYSKQAYAGRPVEFNDAFVQTADQRGGPITAAFPMDDKLILFKKDHVFYVVGEGPGPNGLNNDFSASTLVTTDCGCVNQASIVSTPLGLMFESAKGIQLLDRSTAIKYVGLEVERITNASRVRSAQLMPDSRTVRFALSSGTVLVYDYYFNQWAVFTNHNAASSCIFGGRFTHIRPTGEVMQETPDAYTDDGAFIPMRVKTSWLSFAGLQGFQRVYRCLILGAYASTHKLRLQVAHDFNPEPSQDVYVDCGEIMRSPVYGNDIYGEDSPYGGDHPLYQFRLHLARQKSQAVQLTIEDTQAPPFGEGLSLSAIAFEVGAKYGANKVPKVRSVG